MKLWINYLLPNALVEKTKQEKNSRFERVKGPTIYKVCDVRVSIF